MPRESRKQPLEGRHLTLAVEEAVFRPLAEVSRGGENTHEVVGVVVAEVSTEEAGEEAHVEAVGSERSSLTAE